MTRILLVEDNHLNREMFARRLERKGFQVVCAADGREAVHKVQSEAVHLVLMDLSLPVMDGWEATRRLKGDAATRAIPVIAMTAHAMVGDREKALAAGCDDYETKPVDLPRLLAKINTLTSSRPAVAAVRPPTATPAPPREAARSARKQPSPAGAPPAILVADDNQLNRELLSRRLERERFRVTLARDGREAIDLLVQERFDLVLLDLMMPQVNGIEVLRHIRASYSMLELPVIILTAKDQSDDMVTALKLGANDYVTKPFNFPVLLARLETQLSLRGGRAAAPEAGPHEATKAAAAGRRPGPHSPAFRAGHADLPASPPAPALTPASGTLTLTPPPERGDAGGDAFPAERPFAGRADKRFDPQDHTWADSPTITEGVTFADYQVLEELGRGGMGVVFKARHLRMNRVVALKIIHKEHLARPNGVQRFYREIQAAAQLNHPNIVLAYDAGQFEGTHFFAMEFVEGVDLNHLVKRQGQLPVPVACRFVAEAALGLQHAHEQGLVHRDIKPSNLLATWRGTSPSWPGAAQERVLPPLDKATIKILDFGVALLYDTADPSAAAAGMTRDGRVVGTADYMAPEQWMNAHKVDVRADLYSLGGTLYYLLTAQVPFPADEPMEKMLKHHLDEPVPVEMLRPNVPAVVSSVLRRLLAKKPEQRFQQPWELAEALRGAAEG